MGTRSKTFIVENYDKVKRQDYTNCIAMYRQYDGYPEGHGLDLAIFLKPFTIVNGISLNETRKIANGLDCLAAQMVEHFKNGAGGIYLDAHEDVDGLDYFYTIYEKDNVLMMQCWEVSWNKDENHTLVYEGTPSEFLEWVKKEAE